MNFIITVSCFLAVVSAKPEAKPKPGIIAPLSYSYGHSIITPGIYTNNLAPLTYIASPVVQSYSLQAPILEKSQYHSQDILGQASYGHSEPLQSHNAVQDVAGNKIGSYSYISPDGRLIQTSYIADGLGYRVATNALPEPVRENPNVPNVPVETPEVIAARSAHLKEHEEVKSRQRRSPGYVVPLAYSTAEYSNLALSPVSYYQRLYNQQPIIRTAPSYHPY